jgi:hypothetical protein
MLKDVNLKYYFKFLKDKVFLIYEKIHGIRNRHNRDFKLSVQSQFEKMSGYPLFRVNVSGDELWELYLKSFPEGINLIFRERTKHDCSACRHFIKKVGNVVAIGEDYNIISIWDVQTVKEKY